MLSNRLIAMTRRSGWIFADLKRFFERDGVDVQRFRSAQSKTMRMGSELSVTDRRQDQSDFY
jgi:hypothetical protein